MTRGFITMATGSVKDGSDKYYRLAANLLKSYRLFTREALPFCILAEEENEYTALFDDVILLKNPTRSVMDRMQMLTCVPYDETICIESDSLCYDDLNVFFDLFQDATDFSAFGDNCEKDDHGIAWYDTEDIGSYADLIDYKCRMHGGVVFLRRSEKLQKFHDDCLRLDRDYDQLLIRFYKTCRDECIFDIAMPMNGFKTVPEPGMIFSFYPLSRGASIDLSDNELSYESLKYGYSEHGVLIHFRTLHTRKPFYRHSVRWINALEKYGGTIPRAKKLTLLARYSFDRLILFLRRCINKICRILRIPQIAKL